MIHSEELQTPLNRSFARRIGKHLSNSQKQLLAEELPKYLFSEERLRECIADTTNLDAPNPEVVKEYTEDSSGYGRKTSGELAQLTIVSEHKRDPRFDAPNPEVAKVYLEIGFGMGNHFIKQAKDNQDALFIGAEPYLNGVANVLKLAQDEGITNFLLWSDDIDLILANLPDNLLQGIYILFPDPWLKRRQLKKRILNKERLVILERKLQKDGFIAFASDIEDYFSSVEKLFLENGNFVVKSNNYLQPHSGYVKTKYHEKAIEEGRSARFMQCFKRK